MLLPLTFNQHSQTPDNHPPIHHFKPSSHQPSRQHKPNGHSSPSAPWPCTTAPPLMLSPLSTKASRGDIHRRGAQRGSAGLVRALLALAAVTCTQAEALSVLAAGCFQQTTLGCVHSRYRCLCQVTARDGSCRIHRRNTSSVNLTHEPSCILQNTFGAACQTPCVPTSNELHSFCCQVCAALLLVLPLLQQLLLFRAVQSTYNSAAAPPAPAAAAGCLPCKQAQRPTGQDLPGQMQTLPPRPAPRLGDQHLPQ